MNKIDYMCEPGGGFVCTRGKSHRLSVLTVAWWTRRKKWKEERLAEERWCRVTTILEVAVEVDEL